MQTKENTQDEIETWEAPTIIHRMKKPQRVRGRSNEEKSRPYGQHFPTSRARSENEK